MGLSTNQIENVRMVDKNTQNHIQTSKTQFTDLVAMTE